MPVALEALSADPRLDDALQKRVGVLRELLAPALDRGLVCVLLAGSLGRGKAFGLLNGTDLHLLSDVDLYLVHRHPQEAQELVELVRRWVATDPFFTTPADVAVVEPEYFELQRHTLPARRLLREGRVLLGDVDFARALIEQAAPAVVDAGDAHRLLLNRLVESFAPERVEPESLAARVHRLKCVVDLPLAWLAMTGDPPDDRPSQVAALRDRVEVDGDSENFETGFEWMRDVVGFREWGLVDAPVLASLARDAEALRAWARPFAMACLDRACGGSGRVATTDFETEPELGDAVARWLVRESPAVRLRRARQWTSIAPRGSVTPWWRHGPGGVGIERVWAAGLLCFFGVAEWRTPLRGLNDSIVDPVALHELWQRWLTGGTS